MVTQHGLPKTGRSSNSNNNTSANSTSLPAAHTRPSNPRPNGHSRAVSSTEEAYPPYSPSLPSSPPNARRNSLPEDSSFPLPDNDNEHDHSHLDSHITFLDSLDLDSVSTVDSEEPSPRVKRLCQTPGAKCSHSIPRRYTSTERRLDFSLTKSPEDFSSNFGPGSSYPEQRPNPRRVGSAQSGRSLDSRPSTANSIREEDEEAEALGKMGSRATARQTSGSGGRPESSTSTRSEQERKGPILGLTTSPGRRRHRPSMSTDALDFDKKGLDGEETGEQTGATMSAWRRRRIAETAAAGRKPVARSLSTDDYNKEEQHEMKKAEKPALDEISKGKERLGGLGGGGGSADSIANGSPSRTTSRRVVSSNGTATIRPSGLGGGSGSVDKGKGSILPHLTSQAGTGNSKSRLTEEVPQPAAAAAAAAAAIAREEAARRMRSSTVIASSDKQRTSPVAGSKERPSSSASLRSNIPRPPSGPNTPIKAKTHSLSSLASPSRAKSGLPSPSPRHERTKSAAPSMLHRSSSSASTTAPATSRLHRSNSSASTSTSVSATSSGRDSTIRNRDPPKLRNFTAPVQPSPIQEASQEDISRRVAMSGSPSPAEFAKESFPRPSSSNSRPSSSHSAVYSPIKPFAEARSKEEEEHHNLVDHIETLRKITRASPPSSGRSSWSTEDGGVEGEEEVKPRERRREDRRKEDERKDAEREAAKVRELIASIDSLRKGQEIESPPRLSRTKSLDSVLPQRLNGTSTETGKEATPVRPMSAGRDSRNGGLITPAKMFSPDSEMGEFTERLLRSPAVEDYEDLLNMEDSDKEGEDSMRQQQRVPLSPVSLDSPTSPLAEKHSPTIEDPINIPQPPRETLKSAKPRQTIIKTAVIKKTIRPRTAIKLPKRSILEDDSDVDSLDHLIENDQDFSALLNPTSSDEEDIDSIELLTGTQQYQPEDAASQKVRTRDEVQIADHQREKERAVHEKLMNRLKTLQLEVRSTTRGIEVLEQWLQSPDSAAGSDIVENIEEQEGILYRLRCEEERQRARLEWRILEEAAATKKKNRLVSWKLWCLKWGCIVALGMMLWAALEVAVLYAYPFVDYQIGSFFHPS